MLNQFTPEQVSAIKYAWALCMLSSKEPHENSDPLVANAKFDWMESKLDTYGYVAEFSDFLIFVPRETRGLFTDGHFTPLAWAEDLYTVDCKETDYGTFHKGFHDIWDTFQAFVFDHVASIPKDKPFICRGYSQGGAIARHASLHVGKKFNRDCNIITFGEPKIGKQDVVDTYSTLRGTSLRIINGYDVVPNVPLYDMGYRDIREYAKFPQPEWHKFPPFDFADHAHYNAEINKL